MLTVVPDVAGALPADGQPSSLIDQIVRDGARQMLAAALQAEVAAYIDQFGGRARRGRPPPGGAQRHRRAADGADQRRARWR